MLWNSESDGIGPRSIIHPMEAFVDGKARIPEKFRILEFDEAVPEIRVAGRDIVIAAVGV
jgi:hypothetical protein